MKILGCKITPSLDKKGYLIVETGFFYD